MDFQRQILKGLMNPYVPSSQRRFTDDEVCKHYLAGGFCPSELFVNTKSDLGPCDKIHDEHLREEYLKNSENDRYGWERDFYEYLQSLVNDLDRKIRRGTERVEMKVEESATSKDEREEKTILLEDKIETIVKEIEKAGKAGNIKEAVKQLKLLEEKNTELATLKGERADPKVKKAMEVCEVCGAILVVNDSSQRLDAHLQGKQHSGYKRIREALEQNKELIEKLNKNRDHRRDYDYRHGSSRDRERSRDRDRDRERSRSSRDRDHDRSRRDYHDYRRYDRRSSRDRYRSRSPRRYR
jgi:hypothetical protein